MKTWTLCYVTFAVLFGEAKPRLNATPPLTGILVEDVANASFIICLTVPSAPHLTKLGCSQVECALLAGPGYGARTDDVARRFLKQQHSLLKKHLDILSIVRNGLDVVWTFFGSRVYSIGHDAVMESKVTADVTSSALELLGLAA